MTPTLCMHARELLGWTRIDLAREAHCSSETIKNFEEQRRETAVSIVTALQRALEGAGIEFTDLNGEVPGVRLRKFIP